MLVACLFINQRLRLKPCKSRGLLISLFCVLSLLKRHIFLLVRTYSSKTNCVSGKLIQKKCILVFPLLLHTNTASSAVFLGPPAYSLSTTATLSIQPSPSTSHNLFICHSVLTYVKEICKKSVKAYVEEICKSRHLSSRICRW